jgi:leucine dehydrogenase
MHVAVAAPDRGIEMTELFEVMAETGAHRIIALNDAASGLRAIIAIDDVTLGPACGGIRTQPYRTTLDALADVRKLSSAMTLKCAIAGLDAGGGKTVVIDHPGMDRGSAFRKLGKYIEELGGLYRCAGDLGTTHHDLLNVAENAQYCNISGEELGDATGTTIVNGIRACAAERDITDLSKLSIAVQGTGLIGAGVARALARLGAHVLIADVDTIRARTPASEIGSRFVDADSVLKQKEHYHEQHRSSLGPPTGCRSRHHGFSEKRDRALCAAQSVSGKNPKRGRGTFAGHYRLCRHR